MWSLCQIWILLFCFLFLSCVIKEIICRLKNAPWEIFLKLLSFLSWKYRITYIEFIKFQSLESESPYYLSKLLIALNKYRENSSFRNEPNQSCKMLMDNICATWCEWSWTHFSCLIFFISIMIKRWIYSVSLYNTMFRTNHLYFHKLNPASTL